ncbi:MAG: nitrile hydratase subunit alpha [Rhodospirillales bacterium]|nr:nitrile hydratase subunit alpha [Rhodospirillales bacterium]
MPHDHDDLTPPGVPHKHPFQEDHPEPQTYHQLLGVALHEVLIEKGVYTMDEMRARMERIEGVSSETHGARIVARAWLDDDFKAKLIDNAFAAIKLADMDPGYAEITVLENTPSTHNVVVCTLCSCYPRSLLGRPPAWYKSKSYRARVVREPREGLAEFGTPIPDNQDVTVHDSTAELRYIVLPMRPAGTEGWSEDQLATLVSRDSMIGVARASDPE